MKHLVPHAVIVLALAALAGGMPETPGLVVLGLAHLSAPVWSAAISRRGKRTRAFLLGPGSVIAVHAIALAVTFLIAIGSDPEGSWLWMLLVMSWALALAAYVVYCAFAFALVARRSR